MTCIQNKLTKNKHFFTIFWHLFICKAGAGASKKKVTGAGAGQERTGSGARAVKESARSKV